MCVYVPISMYVHRYVSGIYIQRTHTMFRIGAKVYVRMCSYEYIHSTHRVCVKCCIYNTVSGPRPYFLASQQYGVGHCRALLLYVLHSNIFEYIYVLSILMHTVTISRGDRNLDNLPCSMYVSM